jgi:hypothetical protein
MKRYDALRERAREWRVSGSSLDEICGRLGLSKGTVHHWIVDIPLQRRSRSGDNFRRTGSAQVLRLARFKELRRIAYEQGKGEFLGLARDPSFRDFVMLFMTEGHRRGQHCVSIANSNPALVSLAFRWMKELSHHRIAIKLQVHADQDPKALRIFWGELLGADTEAIRISRKSNSGALAVRKWRSVHGVATVTSHDTAFRERMRGWCEQLELSWKISTGD